MPHLDLRQNRLNGLAVPLTKFAKSMNETKSNPARPVSSTDQAKYLTAADLDTALLAAGYTQARLDTMTQNDKVFALRQAQNLL